MKKTVIEPPTPQKRFILDLSENEYALLQYYAATITAYAAIDATARFAKDRKPVDWSTEAINKCFREET